MSRQVYFALHPNTWPADVRYHTSPNCSSFIRANPAYKMVTEEAYAAERYLMCKKCKGRDRRLNATSGKLLGLPHV